jgi:hypothetical protein
LAAGVTARLSWHLFHADRVGTAVPPSDLECVLTAGILPWFFSRFASRVGICVAWVLFQGCVHVREIWRDMTLILT